MSLFACPENLSLVQHIAKRNYSTHPLAASDPEGYTEFMPDLMNEIETLGINRYFPPGFTLNFVPPVDPGPLATPLAQAEYQAKVDAIEIADYEFPSNNFIIARDLNTRLRNYNSARLPDGTYPPAIIHFTPGDNAMLISVNSSLTIEEGYKELELLGPFLIKLKNSLTT